MAAKNPSTNRRSRQQKAQVSLSPEGRAKYKIYATIRGFSPEQVMAYALKDWMERIGDCHLENDLGLPTGSLNPAQDGQVC